MPDFIVFRSILTLTPAERDANRRAHRALLEAEIRQGAREVRLISFAVELGSDPVSDTDQSPPMTIGEA